MGIPYKGGIAFVKGKSRSYITDRDHPSIHARYLWRDGLWHTHCSIDREHGGWWDSPEEAMAFLAMTSPDPAYDEFDQSEE